MLFLLNVAVWAFCHAWLQQHSSCSIQLLQQRQLLQNKGSNNNTKSDTLRALCVVSVWMTCCVLYQFSCPYTDVCKYVPAVVSQCNKHRALSTWRPKPLLCPNDNSFLVLLDRYNVMLFSRWHVSVQMLVVNASAAVPKWQQRPCTLTTWYRYNVALTTAMLCSNVCVTPLLCLRQRQDTVTKLWPAVHYRLLPLCDR